MPSVSAPVAVPKQIASTPPSPKSVEPSSASKTKAETSSISNPKQANTQSSSTSQNLNSTLFESPSNTALNQNGFAQINYASQQVSTNQQGLMNTNLAEKNASAHQAGFGNTNISFKNQSSSQDGMNNSNLAVNNTLSDQKGVFNTNFSSGNIFSNQEGFGNTNISNGNTSTHQGGINNNNTALGTNTTDLISTDGINNTVMVNSAAGDDLVIAGGINNAGTLNGGEGNDILILEGLASDWKETLNSDGTSQYQNAGKNTTFNVSGFETVAFTEALNTPAEPINSAPIDRNIDIQTLSTEERTAAGLNDRDRAVLHLYGRAIISKAPEESVGNVYQNIIDENGEGIAGTEAEQILIREMRARDQAMFGMDTGYALEEEFFTLHQRLTGEDLSTRYANRDVRAATGPLDIVNDIETLEARNGLSKYEQGVLRLYGHEPLLNGGSIDGSSLAYTIGNANALDSNEKSGNNGVDDVARSLLEADIASDGVINGDSLNRGFVDVMDKIYGVGEGTNAQTVKSQALDLARSLGRSAEQISKDVAQGVDDAISTAVQMFSEHPIETVAGVGGMAAAIAVCPFLGGLGASGVAANFGSDGN